MYRYEDMKEDESGTVLRVSDFLGVPVTDTRATNIAEITTFNKMKQDPTANFEVRYIPHFGTINHPHIMTTAI